MTLWSRFLSRARSWVRATLRRSRMERDMDAELRFHIEAYAEDLIRSGVPREEAMRRARIEFGGVERAKEECRDARGVNFIESLIQDLHFAARMLRKSPGFTCVSPKSRPRRKCCDSSCASGLKKRSWTRVSVALRSAKVFLGEDLGTAGIHI